MSIAELVLMSEDFARIKQLTPLQKSFIHRVLKQSPNQINNPGFYARVDEIECKRQPACITNVYPTKEYQLALKKLVREEADAFLGQTHNISIVA